MDLLMSEWVVKSLIRHYSLNPVGTEWLMANKQLKVVGFLPSGNGTGAANGDPSDFPDSDATTTDRTRISFGDIFSNFLVEVSDKKPPITVCLGSASSREKKLSTVEQIFSFHFSCQIFVSHLRMIFFSSDGVKKQLGQKFTSCWFLWRNFCHWNLSSQISAKTFSLSHFYTLSQ